MERAVKLARVLNGYPMESSIVENHYDNPEFWICFTRAIGRNDWLDIACAHRRIYLSVGNDKSEQYLEDLIDEAKK